MAALRILDLGSDVDYVDGLAFMRAELERVDIDGPALVLLEHRPVVTTTRRGGTGAFVSPRELIEADGIDVVEADRGGDVTFHGPGQLTGYPLLRLGTTSLGCDVVGYVRALEAAIVEGLQRLGVGSARSIEGKDAGGQVLTGVWADAAVVDDETLGCNFHVVNQRQAKVCAIGVGRGGGLTRHGFALNVGIDLERYTRHIVPCGLSSCAVTSLERLLVRPPSMARVKEVVVDVVGARVLPRHCPR